MKPWGGRANEQAGAPLMRVRELTERRINGKELATSSSLHFGLRRQKRSDDGAFPAAMGPRAD